MRQQSKYIFNTQQDNWNGNMNLKERIYINSYDNILFGQNKDEQKSKKRKEMTMLIWMEKNMDEPTTEKHKSAEEECDCLIY